MKKKVQEFIIQITDPEVRKKLDEKNQEEILKIIDKALAAFPSIEVEEPMKLLKQMEVQFILFMAIVKHDDLIVEKTLKFNWKKLQWFIEVRIPQIKQLQKQFGLSLNDVINILYEDFKSIVYYTTSGKKDYPIRGLLGFIMFRSNFFSARVYKRLEHIVDQFIRKKRTGEKVTSSTERDKHLLKEFESLVRV